MALSCPRCGTDVPSEAQYCPYCSLPKPKRGFIATPEDEPQETSPVEHSQPQVAVKKAAKPLLPEPQKRSIVRPVKPKRQLRISVVGVAAIVALISVGVYIFLVPMVYSEQAEPKTVVSALERLRKLPSNEPGITIDARLARELETSRRVGNLTAYQGWNVKPIRGNKSKVVLAFSFVEVGDLHRSAEWMADLNNNTFTPQTDLATSVSAH